MRKTAFGACFALCACGPLTGHASGAGPACWTEGRTCTATSQCCGSCNANGECTCSENGQGCAWSGDCCGSAECVKGICQKTGCGNGTCSADADCCQGVCRGGFCTAGSDQSTPGGASLGGGSGCVGGVGTSCDVDAGATCCDTSICRTNWEGIQVCCVPDGEPLPGGSAYSDCCSGAVGVDGLCNNHCAREGQSCDGSAVCCSGVCNGGTCACTAAGNTCQKDDECCSGICSGGICAACNPKGSVCSTSASCCSGDCTNQVCGCGQPGADATAGSDCCTGLAYLGKCVACEPAGGGCAQDGDCCSGLSCIDPIGGGPTCA